MNEPQINKTEYTEELAPFVIPLLFKLKAENKPFLDKFVEDNKSSNIFLLLLQLVNELADNLQPELYPKLLPFFNTRVVLPFLPRNYRNYFHLRRSLQIYRYQRHQKYLVHNGLGN